MPVVITLSTAAVIVDKSKAATACARPAYCSSAAVEGMVPCSVRSVMQGDCIAGAISTLCVTYGGGSGMYLSLRLGDHAAGTNPCSMVSGEEQR